MIRPFRKLSQPMYDCVLNACCSRFLGVLNVTSNGFCGSLSFEFTVRLCGCYVEWLMPFSIVVQKSGGRCHRSIDFLSFPHDGALWSDASSDLHVMTWRQSSILQLHMQHGFASPKYCWCQVPVCHRLWVAFATAVCFPFENLLKAEL
jgi:hypothetical protein